MFSAFSSDGRLPQGLHPFGWSEFVSGFGWNPWRLKLLGGLECALVPLRTAGCRRIYVDGSFVTAKDLPGDFDVAWDPIGMDLSLLQLIEPVFFDFAHKRAAQKAKYLGEFFPSAASADRFGTTFYEFFQLDKDSGLPKGIVVLTP